MKYMLKIGGIGYIKCSCRIFNHLLKKRLIAMKKFFICTFILMYSSFAMADNCNNPRDDFDSLYCLNKVYQEADKDLNKAYKKLKKLLKRNGRKKLKNRQIVWIKRRNNDCSFRKNGMFFVSLSCTTKTTIARTNELMNRIRECKATGCQASKL